MISHQRKTENVHIILWLIKDACWLIEFKTLGLIMIFPTIFVAIYLTWKFRSDITDLVHNFAICFWIAANSTWMIGEFFYDDTTRPLALVFFILGLTVLAIFYGWLFLFKKRKLIE